MIFFDWLPISAGAYVFSFLLHLNLKTIIWRAVLKILPQRVEDLFPRWMLNSIFGIYGFFLGCIYRLNEIQEIIRRVLVRLTLVIQSLWNIDSFAELLSLQQEYLEAKQQQTSYREFARLNEFEDSMNHLLARGSRVCLREINSMSDLIAHFCDVMMFASLIWSFLKCAVRYVHAKRMNRMTERWIRVVSSLQDEARNFTDDEWIIYS